MATKRWLGLAQDVQQHHTWTITGTWATGDTTTWTINDKSLILTLGTDVAVSDVAAEIAAMINAKGATLGLVGATNDETRNFGGQEFPEWQEVVASSSGAVLTIKCTAGIPVTITATESTAGNGAVGSATVVQAATGKNFFNDAANWSGGTLPSAGDIILFDQGNVDVLYGLNETSTINNLSLVRTNGYTGNIGLLPIHTVGGQNSNNFYVEYRTRRLYLPNSSGSQSFQIGDINPVVPPKGRTYVDLGTGTTTSLNIEVFDAPPVDEVNGYPIQLVRGKKIALTVHSGGASVGADNSLSDNSEINSVTANGDATVLLDNLTSLNANAAIALTGNGSVLAYGNVADATSDVVVYGGTFETYLSQIDTLQCRGGKAIVQSGTITTVTVHGGAVLEEGLGDVTVTNCTAYKGASIKNRKGKITFTNGIDASGCQITDVLTESPDHLTWTPSAI